jgi:hypothetical protein
LKQAKMDALCVIQKKTHPQPLSRGELGVQINIIVLVIEKFKF